MNNRILTFAMGFRTSIAVGVALFSWLTAAPVFPESSGSSPGVPVRLHGETLFTIQTGLADFDALSRAAAIEKRLDRLAQTPAATVIEVAVQDHEQTSYIVTPEEVLFVVTDDEAKAAGKPRRALAEEQADKIRDALRVLTHPRYRGNQEPRSVCEIYYGPASQRRC